MGSSLSLTHSLKEDIMGKWRNWEMDVEYLRPLFEEQIKNWGKVSIYTNVDYVSQSGMTAYISAFVIAIDDRNNKPYLQCIAREVKVGGCGYNRAHHLAYSLYHKVFVYGEDPKYQTHMEHISI